MLCNALHCCWHYPESSLALLPHVGPYSSNAAALGIYPTLSFLYEKKGNWGFFDFKKLKKIGTRGYQ